MKHYDVVVAGAGPSGATAAYYLAKQGKNVAFDIQVDQDSLKGTLNYRDTNYDLLGNAINYYVPR